MTERGFQGIVAVDDALYKIIYVTAAVAFRSIVKRKVTSKIAIYTDELYRQSGYYYFPRKC